MEPLLPDDPPAVGGYRLLGRLGAGGQGVVYLGQGQDGRQVAVKVLLDGLAGDGRFAKEIDAARRVEPFCIAQVLDASLGGRPYIVTEYVEGPSLQQAGRHTGADLQRLAVATATALAAIHRAGVVHRDFKPANVLLGRDGARVIDFGIARAHDAALTVTSSIVGTPAYMAPEQLAGAPVDPAVDVFAWASVIVFAATGRPPFGNDSLPAVIRRILHDPPQLGDLPGPLCPIVLACLAKDPAARPTMQDVLFQLIGAQPVSGGTAGRAGGRRRGRAVLMGGGALVLSGALVAGAVTWSNASAPDGTTGTGPLASITPGTPGSSASSKAGVTPTGTPRSPHAKPTRTSVTAKPTGTRKPVRTPEPTVTPVKTATTKPPTTKPSTTKPASGGSFRLVSLTLDGAQGTGKSCWTSSVYPIAIVKGPSGKQIPYTYRWIIDGEDSGRITSWVNGGQDKVQRGVGSSFEEGSHTVTFRLVSPSTGGRTLRFSVCPPYTH